MQVTQGQAVSGFNGEGFSGSVVMVNGENVLIALTSSNKQSKAGQQIIVKMSEIAQ